MFEHLNAYDQILVTGPHRAGTTIAARMIATDTDLSYVDEARFGINDASKLRTLLQREEKVVVQCPCMAPIIETFSADHRLIVFMIRDTDDIQASQWGENRAKVKERRGLTPDACLPCILYDNWPNQKAQIEHALDLHYESLKTHPLWVPKEKRRNWKVRQWRV